MRNHNAAPQEAARTPARSDDMTKRIVYIALGLIVVLGCWYAWQRHAQQTSLDDGSVISTDSPVTTKERMDTGAVDIDGRPKDSSTGSTGTSTYTGSTGNTAPNPAVRNLPNAAPPASMSQGIPAPANPALPPMQSGGSTPSSLPASDTLSPNPPSGMAFGGSGRFQWYRQGNLTWRINTQTGSSCVAFATMDEWQKPLVYNHGCGNG
jgi:hypothetical protein